MATQDAPAATDEAQASGYFDRRLIGHPSLMLAVLGQQAIHRIRDELSEHGLKPRQLQVLEFLAERDAVGQRELGEQLLIDHSILVTMLNPLEAEGLIERRRSCTDRRRHNVSITTAGRKRQSEASASVGRLEEQILEALPEQGRRQLAELLWTLMSAAQQQHGEEC
jgi:DNA-binding MarR family transcriptional regulator